jgi:hypothetical protein
MHVHAPAPSRWNDPEGLEPSDDIGGNEKCDDLADNEDRS